MPRPTTEFQYARKSVRITVPLASDEHIQTAAMELQQLAQTLSEIHQQKTLKKLTIIVQKITRGRTC